GVSLGSHALRHAAERNHVMGRQELANVVPQRSELRRADETGKIAGEQRTVIIGNLAAEPDKPVADQAALDAEREDEKSPAFTVPSHDNGGLHALPCPDMALPGRKPGE